MDMNTNLNPALGSPSAASALGSPSAGSVLGSPSAASALGSPSAASVLGSPSAASVLGSPSAASVLGSPSAGSVLGSPSAGSALPVSHSPHRGWYSRGYLPHCDHPGLLQSITYHLSDSLPASALERMSAELQALPERLRDVEQRKRIEDWLDAGYGCCVLREPEVAGCVLENWRHFAGERYDLIAWVVMPNHVHILVRVYEGVALGKIVQSWKSYTGNKIRQMLEQSRAGAPWPERQDRRRSRQDGVWMRGYWDRYIRDERHFETVVRYIHRNPVKAGLVDMATDWPWSSARELGELAEQALGDPRGCHDESKWAEQALGDPRGEDT